MFLYWNEKATGVNSHRYESLWYDILCWYHVNEYRSRSLRGNRDEVVPEWKTHWYYVNTPLAQGRKSWSDDVLLLQILVFLRFLLLLFSFHHRTVLFCPWKPITYKVPCLGISLSPCLCICQIVKTACGKSEVCKFDGVHGFRRTEFPICTRKLVVIMIAFHFSELASQTRQFVNGIHYLEGIQSAGI